jgi:hypothetical protein
MAGSVVGEAVRRAAADARQPVAAGRIAIAGLRRADDEARPVAVGVIAVALVGGGGDPTGQPVEVVVGEELVRDGLGIGIAGDARGGIEAQDAAIAGQRTAGQTTVAIEAAGIVLAVAPGPTADRAEGLVSKKSIRTWPL